MATASNRLVPALAAICLLLLGWLIFLPHVGTQAEPPKARPVANRSDLKTVDVPFEGARAFAYLKNLCAIGPRISGSAGIKKMQDVVKTHFEKHGATVAFQRFTAKQNSQPRPTEFANVIASWRPERTRRVIICSHYDTRPKADQEPNPRRWDEPFVSANDGTAGVAWLMELAHHVKAIPAEVGIDLVLFDGEEYIFDGPSPDSGLSPRDRYFIGSEHFAMEYKSKPPAHKYVAAVLLDMAAGKNATFPIEGHSGTMAGALTNEIWDIAETVGARAFQKRWVNPVLDDHLALNRAGIPAVDIIDFGYPHWHRLTDLPDQCSPETMTQVAGVLTTWLQRVR